MTFFNNIKLFWKFSIFGAVASLLLVATMLVSYSGMKGTEQRFDRYSGTFQALALTVSEMHTQGVQAEQAIRNVIFNPTDEKAMGNFKKANTDVLELHKQSMALAQSLPEYVAKLKDIPTLWQENGAIKEQIIELARSGDQPGAVAMLNKEETPAGV